MRKISKPCFVLSPQVLELEPQQHSSSQMQSFQSEKGIPSFLLRTVSPSKVVVTVIRKAVLRLPPVKVVYSYKTYSISSYFKSSTCYYSFCYIFGSLSDQLVEISETQSIPAFLNFSNVVRQKTSYSENITVVTLSFSFPT